MSIHPSLSSSDKDKKQRSVLKRIERLKMMMEKDEWKEGDDVFGLPKIKTLRIKIKKEKVAEKPEEALAAEGAEGAAPAAAEGEKEVKEGKEGKETKGKEAKGKEAKGKEAKKEEPTAKKSAAKGPKGQEKK